MNSESSSAILRLRMVNRDLADVGIVDERILNAFMKIPREDFVPPRINLVNAYGNHPLPIGLGQTVSQPYIVAFMLQMLECEPGNSVLEIGTGSGYQTAILAAMGMKVVTIELLPDLAVNARKAVLAILPGADIRFIVADGYNGWTPAAPYDCIIVSAAPARMPDGLEDQLNPLGGRLVIPLGDWSQRLISITRNGDDLVMRESLPVRFVPLVKPRRE
ncbi:MAG: protein-L-isoaspartate(D-aspartate) O-methyltransferase [Candidatus Aegiribacteria sp.]|nr:protein-L-isoaspartate(D-aspartate) O-methyltransferase [Candidatus Aegiribacteria sp.]